MQTTDQKRLKLVKSSGIRECNPASEKKSESSLTIDEYYQRAEQYAQRIRRTQDVDEIIGILDTVLSETRNLRNNDEITSAQEQILYAEQKIESLRHELELIRELVYTDQATGLFNQRGLDELFTREAARADRNKGSLCTILIDLDNFKDINEIYGYPFGDNTLVHFAKLIKNTLRPSDVVARYGGEEFVILLPDTHINDAIHVIQRLQCTIAASPMLNTDNQPVSLTFSGGMVLRQTNEPQHSVIRRANEALSRAKNTGKARIEIAL